MRCNSGSAVMLTQPRLLLLLTLPLWAPRPLGGPRVGVPARHAKRLSVTGLAASASPAPGAIVKPPPALRSNAWRPIVVYLERLGGGGTHPYTLSGSRREASPRPPRRSWPGPRPAPGCARRPQTRTRLRSWLAHLRRQGAARREVAEALIIKSSRQRARVPRPPAWASCAAVAPPCTLRFKLSFVPQTFVRHLVKVNAALYFQRQLACILALNLAEVGPASRSIKIAVFSVMLFCVLVHQVLESMVNPILRSSLTKYMVKNIVPFFLRSFGMMNA